MSQAELARVAGVDPRTVRRIESGESVYPAKAGLLQKALRIGPYAPASTKAADDAQDAVLLRDATFPELLQAIALRYGDAVRAGQFRQPAEGDVTHLDHLPADVEALGPNGVPGEWVNPNEGRSSG